MNRQELEAWQEKHPEWLHGAFNVRKCVLYLRGVGAEIPEALAASWQDAEKAHRLLRDMKRTRMSGWDWRCREGHMTYIESRRRRRNKADAVCSTCGGPLVQGWARWYEAKDGTVHDMRPKSERWRGLRDPIDPDAEPPAKPWESPL